MKKWIVTTAFLLIFGFAYQHDVQAKVIWDKSEIVERQSGKMSFIKDVKIYKPMADGTFTSMIAKKNNFFRVYDIEKYNGKVYYWMSSGYRIEATDLVTFKAVPMEIRASFYENPGYIITNHDGFQLTRDYPKEFAATHYKYGTPLHHWNYVYAPEYNRQLLSFDKEYLLISKGSYDQMTSIKEHGRIHGTDIKVVPQQEIQTDKHIVKADVPLHYAPLANAKTTTTIKANTQVNTRSYIAVNGYIEVYIPSANDSVGYLTINSLTP